MKAIIFLLVLLPVLAIGQCNSTTFGILKAEVHGDTVILQNDTAYRNCGAIYSMGISSLNNDTLIWMQTDIGSVAYCYCYFNLSVTIDSLKPGNYSVKVYYSDLVNNDTCYIGSVSFTITNPNSYLSPSIQNQEQSSCFLVGVSDEKKSGDIVIKVYPNPTKGFLNIFIDLYGDKLIRISDLENKSILEFISDKNENVIDLRSLPNNMYFVTVKTKEKSLHSKFCKY
jgi:hypothetical protein